MEVFVARFGRQECEKVSTRTAECDRLAYGHEGDGRFGFDDSGALDGLVDIVVAVIEERRIAGTDGNHDIIETQSKPESDDMLHHAQVVVRISGAEHDIAGSRPDVSDGDADGKLLR